MAYGRAMKMSESIVMVRFFVGPQNDLSARVTDVMSKSTWHIADARALWRLSHLQTRISRRVVRVRRP